MTEAAVAVAEAHAAPAVAEPPAAAPETDARASTIEWLEQLQATPEGEPAPAPADAQAPAVAPAAAPAAPAEPEAFQAPDLAGLTELARSRADDRRTREAAEAPVLAHTAELKAQIAELKAIIANATPEPTGPKLTPEQQLMADAFEERIAPLQKRIEEATAPPPPAAAPDLATAQDVFAAYVGGAGDRFPKLASLPPAYAKAVAWQHVQSMRAAGLDTTRLTDEQIAGEVERALTPSSGTPPAAQGGTPLASPGTAPAANGGPPTPSAPRSITAGSAADGARRPPETDEECHDDAVAWLQGRQG